MFKIYGKKDKLIIFYDGVGFTADKTKAKCYMLTNSVLSDWEKLKVNRSDIKELNWTQALLKQVNALHQLYLTLNRDC